MGLPIRELHVATDIKMVAGDGPISVTLKKKK